MTTQVAFAPDYKRDEEHPDWIIFPRDVEWRRKLFSPGASEHPAKMQMHIVKASIEAYAKPGDVVLDPFAGTGTTGLAATMGYKTILIELEDQFKDMLVATRKKWLDEQLIPDRSWLQILFGDCRKVMRELPEQSVDLIVTSPPYSVTAQVGKEVKEFTGILAERKAQMRRYGSSESDYLNIGRLNTFDFNQEMQKVYREVVRLLKPGGLYISVTKDNMTAGKRNRLSMDVMRTCGRSGLEYTGDWWKWKAPGGMLQNFQKSKGLDVVLDEDIMVFRRPR